jgi:TPR repeat protein
MLRPFPDLRGRLGWGLAVIGVLAVGAYATAAHEPMPDAAHIAQLQVEAGPAANTAARARLEALARAGLSEAQRAWGEVLVASAELPQVQVGVDWLERAWRAGIPEAALALGKRYLLASPGWARDPARAFTLFESCARAGHAGCAYYVARMYSSGDGVASDKVRAFHWLELAAVHKEPAALFLLANAYRYGEGVAPNEARALALYQEAAEREHPLAIQTLLLAHRYGELGLSPDREAAYHDSLELAHALKHPAQDP